MRKIKGFGWVPDLKDQRDFKFQFPPPVEALPHTTDLRPHCPPIFDQGQLGSCTANAIVGALLFDQIKQGENPTMLSRLMLYYNERLQEGTTDSDAGAAIRDGIKSALADGVCPETEWPYDISQFATRPPAQCYVDAKKFEAVQYAALTQVIWNMRHCLSAGFPFVFGFTCYESLESDATSQTGDIPMPGPAEQVIGGHAIVAVGYDDSKNHFIIRNSWGTGWGQSGYGTIPYAYLASSDLSSDFWVIRSVR